MIQIDTVSKRYGPRSRPVMALRDVSLTIEPGVWGVVGPNGAGKTTLLGLILGFLHPTSGAITIHDDPPRRHLARYGAAYLPERFRLPAAWPVRSALLALARLEGGGHDLPADERTAGALERLGLEEHAHRAVGTLSRGLLQRVGLAQTLLADRRLVVLDEPTEGLDPLWRVRFREIVEGLRSDGRTVLVASHDLGEVERLTDRVILLDDGRVTELLEPRPSPDAPLRYRLIAEVADEGAVPAAFPGAERQSPTRPEGTSAEREPAAGAGTAGGPGAGGGAAGQWLVTVADAGELSHRLAALLDAGAALHAVEPLAEDLETRVRSRLEES